MLCCCLLKLPPHLHFSAIRKNSQKKKSEAHENSNSLPLDHLQWAHATTQQLQKMHVDVFLTFPPLFLHLLPQSVQNLALALQAVCAGGTFRAGESVAIPMHAN